MSRPNPRPKIPEDGSYLLEFREPSKIDVAEQDNEGRFHCHSDSLTEIILKNIQVSTTRTFDWLLEVDDSANLVLELPHKVLLREEKEAKFVSDPKTSENQRECSCWNQERHSSYLPRHRILSEAARLKQAFQCVECFSLEKRQNWIHSGDELSCRDNSSQSPARRGNFLDDDVDPEQVRFR